VLTKTLNLEKGERGGHLYFGKGKSAPYEVKGRLGSGAYGAVQKVVSLLSHQEFARKLVLRAKYGRQNESGIKTFLAELQVLKRVSHSHCANLVCAFAS
jgi:serine/threonine protein kinase